MRMSPSLAQARVRQNAQKRLRLRLRAPVHMCIGLILISGTVQAEFESEINSIKGHLDATANMAADVDSGLEQLGSFTKPDRDEAAKWFAETTKRYTDVLTLFQSGKGDEGRAAWRPAEERGTHAGAFQKRVEFRHHQVDSAPTEEFVIEWHHNTPPSARPAVENLIRARQATSDAWGRAAAACTPEKAYQEFDAISDEAAVLQVHADIAQTRMFWACDMAEIIANRLLSPDVEKKVAALEAAQNEALRLMAERADVDQKIRIANRLRDQAAQQTRETFNKARQAAEDAKRKQ